MKKIIFDIGANDGKEVKVLIIGLNILEKESIIMKI